MIVQRDLFIMSLGVLHRTLSASANEVVECSVERLLRIVHHFSEPPALTVEKEIVTGYSQFGHSAPSGAWAAAKRLGFNSHWHSVSRLGPIPLS